MITRTLQAYVERMAERYPVVTITGPRQSGKTTLCRMAFPDKAYISLEAPDTRAFALDDPRGFLGGLPEGAVLDEVQRAPELLSYLQVLVDEDPSPGRFVLTGSQQLGLSAAISQTLAGRTAVLTLLPLGLEEIGRFERSPEGLLETLLTGGYPAIHDRDLLPFEWLRDYVATYVERDVRQLLGVRDLTTFQTFLGLCAGRSGQLLSLSALGSDAGVSHHTAREWLSVLETGYVAHRLPPLSANINKRLVKTPKLHLYDSGLLCYLLGVHSIDQLRYHPLRGMIFESWVVSEIIKARVHRGLPARAHFYRDRRQLEVDLVLDLPDALVAVEVKSGQTISSQFLRPLEKLSALSAPRAVRRRLVYGGDESQRRSGAEVIPWRCVPDVDWG